MVLESLWWVPTAETAAPWEPRSASPSAALHASDPGQPASVLIGVQASPRSLASTRVSPTPGHARTEPPAVPTSTPPSAVRTRQSTLWLARRVTSPSSKRLKPSDPPRNNLISQPPRLGVPPRACPRRSGRWGGAPGRGSTDPPGHSSPRGAPRREAQPACAREPPECHLRRDRSE